MKIGVISDTHGLVRLRHFTLRTDSPSPRSLTLSFRVCLGEECIDMPSPIAVWCGLKGQTTPPIFNMLNKSPEEG